MAKTDKTAQKRRNEAEGFPESGITCVICRELQDHPGDYKRKAILTDGDEAFSVCDHCIEYAYEWMGWKPPTIT